MIIESYEQRGEDWLMAHLGIPTASQFGKLLTPGGKASDQAEAYMHELIAERLTGKRDENGYSNQWIERGVLLEPEARDYYSMQTDYNVEQVGFIYKDERRLTGCSPDGLIPNVKAGLEIKCPKASTHVKYMLSRTLPSTYLPQVQGSLWITESDTWDWLSYHPDLPPVLLRIGRDEIYIAKLEAVIETFLEQMVIRLRYFGKEL